PESVTKGMQSQQLANLPLLFVEPRLAKATTVWSSKNWPLAVRPLPRFQHLESSGSQGNVPRFGVLAVSRTDCKIAVFHAVSGLKPDIWSTQPEQFAHAKPCIENQQAIVVQVAGRCRQEVGLLGVAESKFTTPSPRSRRIPGT